MKILNRRKAFTLSEVMVALGVLGVLAAITVPVIINTRPDNNKIMFKKAYLTASKVVTEMINDEANYPADSVWTDTLGVTHECKIDGVGDFVQCGFNNERATTNGSVEKFCYFFAEQLNTLGPVTCPESTADVAVKFATTSDGITWYIGRFGSPAFPITTTGSYMTGIAIDVNGPDKGPNCSKDLGVSTEALAGTDLSDYVQCEENVVPDLFIITINYAGKIKVGSQCLEEYCDPYAEAILSNPTDNQK